MAGANISILEIKLLTLRQTSHRATLNQVCIFKHFIWIIYCFIHIILNWFLAWAKLVKIAINNLWQLFLDKLSCEYFGHLPYMHTIFVRVNE